MIALPRRQPRSIRPVRTVTGSHRLGLLLRLKRFIRDKPEWHHDIITQRAPKHERRGGHVPDMRCNKALAGCRKIVAADADRPRLRCKFARQQPRYRSSVFFAIRHQERPFTGFNPQRGIVEHRDTVIVAYRYICQVDGRIGGQYTVRVVLKTVVRHHLCRAEPIRNDVIAQRKLLHLGVVGQQLFPRRGQILERRQRSNKGTNRQLARQHQQSADQKEKERRQLGDEVVEELHEELLAIDQPPDLEQPTQPCADHSHSMTPTCVAPQCFGPGSNLDNLCSQLTDLLDPRLVEQVNPPLQARDQPGLQGDQRHRCQAEPDILDKEEGKDRQHLPGLQNRLGNGIPHDAAQGLRLGRDHRNQLTLGRSHVVAARKEQQARDQDVSKPSQQTLRQRSFHRVDPHLHQPVDHDGYEKGET